MEGSFEITIIESKAFFKIRVKLFCLSLHLCGTYIISEFYFLTKDAENVVFTAKLNNFNYNK